MGRPYIIPFRSKVAGWIADILPRRVLAWMWITAYGSLDAEYKTVYDRESLDGEGLYVYDAVASIRVTTLRHRLFIDVLKAKVDK